MFLPAANAIGTSMQSAPHIALRFPQSSDTPLADEALTY
jgi:hypothetical protein